MVFPCVRVHARAGPRFMRRSGPHARHVVLKRQFCLPLTLGARKCRQMILLVDIWSSILAFCEVVELSIIVKLVLILINISQLLEIDFVA